MLNFLRRLWSWLRQHLVGQSPEAEPVVAQPQPSNLDYEGCLFALIAEMEAGGSWASLQAILIRRRMGAAQLANWLSTFSERWFADAEAYQVLAAQLRQLGEMAALPLGAVAAKVGRQLQVGSDKVAETPSSSVVEDDLFGEQIEAAWEEKDFDKALMIAERYVQQCSEKSTAWYKRGNSLAYLGRYEQALESYDRAIALQPDDAKAWYNRGVSLRKSGRYEQELESYDQAIALQPDLALAWVNRGVSLAYLGRYEQALESYDRAIALQLDDAKAWHNRGVSLDNLGRYEQALESYDRAIALQLDDAKAWYNRGVSLANLGQHEQALESYDRAITLQPDLARPWNNRGNSLNKLGRYEQALESLDQAIALQLDDAKAWYNRGSSLASLGQHEQALESFDQAIALQPDDVTAWHNRGSSLASLGQHEQALESFDQAIALQPDDVTAWHNRGSSLASLGQHEQALESFDQAIVLQPDLAIAWQNRGIAVYRLKERTKQSVSQFASNVFLSLSQSKRQLHNWQPPNTDSLTRALEQSMATSAQRLKEHFPQLANTFSPSLSSALRQFLQQPPNLEPLHALLRQPISETLIQQLAQDERKHPHHANPELNKRGYEGALASYRAPIDKAIRKDTHPEGWAKLHQAIGKAHLHEANLRANPRSLWQQAEHSFKTALSAPDLDSKFPTLYLQLLEPLIDLCIRLGEQPTAEELQRRGHALITKLLQDDKLSNAQKQSFAFMASRFKQLSVDTLVQQNKLNEALATAEAGKKLCLRWLLQLDEVPSVDPTRLQLSHNQAIVYWHLSPSRLTTFLLLPSDTAARVIPLSASQSPTFNRDRPDWLQQQLDWEAWLQQWNHDYIDYSRLNKATSQKNHPWRQSMTQRLNQLSDLLNIDAIKAELSQTQVSELLLVPHRDLHRFPLHGFFADYTCRYLPHLPLQATNNFAEPLPIAPLLIVENPKHQVSTQTKGTKELAALPLTELEAAYLRQLAYPQLCHTLDEGNVTKAQLQESLSGDYRLLHFSGHGIYNASVPAQSCLFLSNADRFTLIDIVQKDLSHFDLVTLAACETALTGSETITDEYVGLVSAFLSAGARCVLSTLWRVESKASMVLIIQFYRNLSQQMPPAVALQQAQSFLANADRQTLHKWFTDLLTRVSDPNMQELIRDRQDEFSQQDKFSQPEPDERPFSHPYFWSPFTLTSL